MASQRRSLKRAVGFMVACWHAAGANTASAQVRVDIRRADDKPPAARWTLEPPNDQDAAAWLKRATQAAEQGDWKLAADTLERLLDQHGDRTVSLDNQHYYSVPDLVRQQVSAWPAEGMAAYRVLYDADASRLLDQAVAEYDLEPLREIARRYSLTTRAPEAFNLLATWLLDRHEPREALDVLARLEHLPHNNVAHWEILLKRAVACTLSQQRDRAAEMLAEMRRMSADSSSGVPADWPARVETVQRFFENQKLDDRTGVARTAAPWAYRLGAGEVGGRMPSIAPIVPDDESFTVLLPGAERLNMKTINRASELRSRPAVWQAVSDGVRLFVTCPAGLFARDLSTFDLTWQAFPKPRMRNPEVGQHRLVVNLGGQSLVVDEGDNSPRLDGATADVLFHEYRGEISTALGLVFVLDQEPPQEEQLPTLEGVLPPNAHLGDETLSEANTLRAYEADSGRLLWIKGRGSPPTDDMHSARFCAAPIQCDSRVMVSFRLAGDLHLAVMERDGRLSRDILLGSGRASLFPMNGVMAPSLHDGVIYLQTGAGVLYAVDAHDFSMKWLTRYTPSERLSDIHDRGGQWWIDDRIGIPQPDQWLTSPPIVSRGVVVLAAQDADKLYAFDTESGVEKWSVPRGENRYLVGADDQSVIVAGSAVEAVSLSDGTTRWRSTAVSPVGRAVICGEEILTPTFDGLARLSLKDGTLIGKIETHGPAGNLFVFDGSVYGLTADRLSKYPDTELTKSLALQQLERNPRDTEALMRLAWLDTVDGRWNDALSFLDRATATVDEASLSLTTKDIGATDEIRNRISHLRVAALLRMAAASADKERNDILARAESAARLAGDRLSAGLARCEYFEDTAVFVDGLTHGIELLNEVGDEPVKVAADLRVRAEVLVAELLDRIWRRMSEADRGQVRPAIERLLDKTRQPERMSNVLAFGDWGRRLDLRLGIEAMTSGRIETGIFHFERAVARSAGTDQVEALALLAIAYCNPGDGLPSDDAATRRVLERLSNEFGELPMPSHIDLRMPLPEGGRIHDFVAALMATMPQKNPSDGRPLPRLLREASRLRLIREVIVSDGNRNDTRDGASFWDRTRPNDLSAQVIPIQLNGEIRGLKISATEDESDWWISNQRSPLEDMSPPISQRESRAYDATIFGRVAVLGTPAQVSAVGLESGRTMWAPLSVDTSSGPLPRPSLVGAGGIVVAAADARTLVAIQARDDATPLWRRTWSDRALRLLSIVGDCVVAVDRDAVKVFVLELQNGRLRCEYPLIADSKVTDLPPVDRENPDAHAAIVGNVVLRSQGRRLSGRDAVSGRPLWTSREFPGIVKAVIGLGGGDVFVSQGTDGFAVIRADSGEIVREWTSDGLAMPPIDAVLDEPAGRGARLTLFTRTTDSPPEFVLCSFPMNAAELPWRRELGPLATINGQMLRASSEFVAAIRNGLPPAVDRRAARRVPVEIDTHLPPKLEIIDKTTGDRFPLRPYEFSEGELGDESATGGTILNASRRIMDIIVLDDRIIGVAPEGFFVLAAADSEGPNKSDRASRNGADGTGRTAETVRGPAGD